MEYKNLLELLKKRRSIRSFKTDPVPDEYIQNIVGTVHWAPSGMNRQPWEVVVVRKQELKDNIVELIAEEMKGITKKMPPNPVPDKPGKAPPSVPGFANAPVFILLFGDNRTRNTMPSMDDDRWNNMLNSNLALGFHNMLLAAATLEIGAQWVSAVSRPVLEKQIKELLRIPDVMRLYAMMAVGYPDMEPIPKEMRELDGMIHYDICSQNDFRRDDEVKDFSNY
ncbi:nitroreductase family protein [Deltaproteobacteria bacterium]|nr:nitroreductase family protein [Deltaproteobacteria bacterium]